jgi:hypothetical protein
MNSIKIRLMVDTELSRQQLRDIIASRTIVEPTEEQVERVWQELSLAPYTEVSDILWEKHEDDLFDMMKECLADIIEYGGMMDDKNEEEPSEVVEMETVDMDDPHN